MRLGGGIGGNTKPGNVGGLPGKNRVFEWSMYLNKELPCGFVGS